MRKAIYPGSFDPITNGHLDILNRALEIFDEVTILVAINPNKSGHFSINERIEMIKEAVDLSKVKVDSTTGLTVKYAKEHGANHLIRGLRAVTDFEYELTLAEANEFVDRSIDTVFLMGRAENNFISSSGIMAMHQNGVDVSKLVPPSVYKRLK